MSQEVRQNLMWTATKARKANLIDQAALEVIRRLVREPRSPDIDRKIEQFAEEFLKRTKNVQNVGDRNGPVVTDKWKRDASIQNESLEVVRLPAALVQKIASFVVVEDMLSLANTCFSLNIAVFPVQDWAWRISSQFTELGMVSSSTFVPAMVGNMNVAHESDSEEDDHDDDDNDSSDGEDEDVEMEAANNGVPPPGIGPGPAHVPLIQEIGEGEFNVQQVPGNHANQPVQQQPQQNPFQHLPPQIPAPAVVHAPPPGAEQPSAYSQEEQRRIISVLNTPNLFACPAELAMDRSYILRLYGRGHHLLSLKSQKALGYDIMLRYMIPQLLSGVLRAKVSITVEVMERGRLSGGEPLTLTGAMGAIGHRYITLQFNVGSSPPVVNVNASTATLHALESDGRSISEVRMWRFIGSPVQRGINLTNEHNQVRGKAYVTLAGERAAKYLGKLIHNDEHVYARELSSSAIGSHGQGSFDVRGMTEVITHETPRITYKAPAGYYEISRNGLVIYVPLITLFNHCVPLPPPSSGASRATLSVRQ